MNLKEQFDQIDNSKNPNLTYFGIGLMLFLVGVFVGALIHTFIHFLTWP